MKKTILYPALKAAITGLFALILAWMVTYFRGSASWPLACLVGSIVAFGSWVLASGNFPKLENQAGNSPLDKQQVTKIQIVGDASSFTAGRWLDLPLSSGEIKQVAKWLNNGADFSHAGLAGAGRPLSRSQFESLRTEFLSRGLVCWRDPACHNRGLVLTKAGQAVLRYFLPSNGHLSLKSQNSQFGAHTHTGIEEVPGDRTQ